VVAAPHSRSSYAGGCGGWAILVIVEIAIQFTPGLAAWRAGQVVRRCAWRAISRWRAEGTEGIHFQSFQLFQSFPILFLFFFLIIFLSSRKMTGNEWKCLEVDKPSGVCPPVS
jgi:hypothetical protein